MPRKTTRHDLGGPRSVRVQDFDPEEGTYGDCHATTGTGQWPASRPYREVITRYVSQ